MPETTSEEEAKPSPSNSASNESSGSEYQEPSNTSKQESSSSPSKPPSVNKEKTAKPPSPGGGIDAHPYARGSVIEVLHGKKEEKEESWWSDDSEDEVEEGDVSTSVRLCDVIDWVKDEDGKCRYYVHYRDFNRRMDEWIPMDLVVSPPSIGNAKAKALKKEEEKAKRRAARIEERNLELAEALSAPRSRRRSTATPTAANASATGETPAAETTPDSETPRSRRKRRKSGTSGGEEEPTPPEKVSGSPETPNTEPDTNKEILKIATSAATETTIGEHVIATIPAQELDEHEGLDEASLREHEEVTKVKNVAFLELGEYQMETWYFSPLPKELLSSGGFIEVLYVCEYSLRMFARKSELLRYQARELPKNKRHPPGNEIYRNGNLSSKSSVCEALSRNARSLPLIASSHRVLLLSCSV